jgi:hypothetical protein
MAIFHLQPFASPARTSAASFQLFAVRDSSGGQDGRRPRQAAILPFIHFESHALKNASIKIGSSAL